MNDFLPDDPFWLQNLEAALTPGIDEIRENVAAANADEPHSDPSEYEAALEWLHWKGPKIAALLLMEMDQAEKWRKTHADLAARATRAQGESTDRWVRRVKTLEARLDKIACVARGEGNTAAVRADDERDNALRDEGAIAALMNVGHTNHCAKRIWWGDGVCTCPAQAGAVKTAEARLALNQDLREKLDIVATVNDEIGRENDRLREQLQEANREIATLRESLASAESDIDAIAAPLLDRFTMIPGLPRDEIGRCVVVEVNLLQTKLVNASHAVDSFLAPLAFLHDDSDGRPCEPLGDIAAREIKRWRKAHGGRWEP